MSGKEKHTKPTWNEFAWAAVVHWATHPPDKTEEGSYQNILKKRLLKTLRTQPAKSKSTQIKEDIIDGFLNAWGCRMEKGKGAANAIRKQLVGLHPYVKKLQGLDIATVNFDTNVFVDGEKITISQAVEKCYKDLRKDVKHRFAATATSKLLHILQPKLFVMWDRKIRDDFHDKNSQVLDSAKGYGTFLQLMQKKATDVCNAFNKRYPRQKRDPAKFLSDNLKYNPPQTFARFLDEYNWITITKGCSIPPPWHPPKLSRKYGGRRRKR